MLNYFRKLYRHFDLIFWLAAKEIKVRYKLPFLGFLWALLVPLFLSLILWFVFTKILPFPDATRHPYFLFLISGIFPWSFFAESVMGSTQCIINSGSMIRKAAFPRAVIPFSVVAANLFNFSLTLIVVIGIILAFGYPLTYYFFLLPLAVLFQLLFTLGMALLVSSLQVHYRDIKYITDLGILLWFYGTPIFYSLNLVWNLAPALQKVYLLNPFVYILELYRLALLGGPTSDFISPLNIVVISGFISIAMFLIGFSLFRSKEAAFADWVLT